MIFLFYTRKHVKNPEYIGVDMINCNNPYNLAEVLDSVRLAYIELIEDDESVTLRALLSRVEIELLGRHENSDVQFFAYPGNKSGAV